MIDFITYDIAAQAVGVLASIFLVLSYLVTSDIRLKLIMCVSFGFFAIHYFMIAALMGMLIQIIDICRISFSLRKQKSDLIMLFFVSIYLVIGYMNFSQYIDLLPIAAGVLGTISMYKLSGLRFRLVLFAITALWLTYGIYVFSIGGIVTNIFLLAANSVTVYRLYREGNKDD